MHRGQHGRNAGSGLSVPTCGHRDTTCDEGSVSGEHLRAPRAQQSHHEDWRRELTKPQRARMATNRRRTRPAVLVELACHRTDARARNVFGADRRVEKDPTAWRHANRELRVLVDADVLCIATDGQRVHASIRTQVDGVDPPFGPTGVKPRRTSADTRAHRFRDRSLQRGAPPRGTHATAHDRRRRSLERIDTPLDVRTVENAVTVDAHDHVSDRHRKCRIQSRRLNATRVVHHPDAWGRGRDLASGVGGAAIGNQDLDDSRIPLGAYRRQRRGQVLLLVVRRDDHADGQRTFTHRPSPPRTARSVRATIRRSSPTL